MLEEVKSFWTEDKKERINSFPPLYQSIKSIFESCDKLKVFFFFFKKKNGDGYWDRNEFGEMLSKMTEADSSSDGGEEMSEGNVRKKKSEIDEWYERLINSKSENDKEKGIEYKKKLKDIERLLNEMQLDKETATDEDILLLIHPLFRMHWSNSTNDSNSNIGTSAGDILDNQDAYQYLLRFQSYHQYCANSVENKSIRSDNGVSLKLSN
ncbi:hypothetical protein RFI_30131 [Reticulomyxa filosa]|uniref:Uncharacterized protein n=1 Tax=Reticulomyxa filosa TaxID=46433 RepID=X6M050_RETFI|nr:hypothetical protein RFI_30131 [Reticulomyxa filosa]|eukprot:ETO07259.1 hypothetical protein RFI_30131 [Reticulomyxa filosa]